jgi:sugar phosphate isomerase/epimerase
MELGYRIIRPEDIGTQPLDFAQISLWRAANWGVAEGEQAVREAIEIAAACKDRGIRTVFHPLEYSMTGESGPQTLTVMRRLAAAADLGIIIHDDGCAGGKRLTDSEAVQYARNVREISGLCHVSIENSFNSGDITWFWERFVTPAPVNVSITLDIGHIELAGLDSVRFVRNMPQHLIERTAFVHMHHHDAQESRGVKDHRPLIAGCREIEALKELLNRKQDVRVVLELDSADDDMRRSIELLRNPEIRTAE